MNQLNGSNEYMICMMFSKTISYLKNGGFVERIKINRIQMFLCCKWYPPNQFPFLENGYTEYLNKGLLASLCELFMVISIQFSAHWRVFKTPSSWFYFVWWRVEIFLTHFTKNSPLLFFIVLRSSINSSSLLIEDLFVWIGIYMDQPLTILSLDEYFT